jgi:transposase
VTLRQLRDNLSARQAAEAVRARIDWQDLVGLALTNPGVDYAVWCVLWARVVSGNAAAMGLDTELACCRAWGWLKTRGTQCTDATPVVAALRVRTRRA